ncbi:MAG: diol dehydratase small subunit [Hyphomicrobiales bacterium]
MREDDPRKAESILGLEDITLDALRDGKVASSDLTIRRQTLLDQAALADSRGYPQLARNFRRAAELTAIPNDVLLEAYEKLRPYRATYYQLLALSQEIAARYDAPETGDYIRQAAEAYKAKGLVKAE